MINGALLCETAQSVVVVTALLPASTSTPSMYTTLSSFTSIALDPLPLCLADQRRLGVSDIIALSRPHGGLAFLSACQTAKGDEDLSDEAIHIAAGMLFAGYGGVVGTMWSISDKLAPDVAKDVYTQLFRNGTTPDYREAARALHVAVGRLRDSDVSFKDWLPFIHVGL